MAKRNKYLIYDDYGEVDLIASIFGCCAGSILGLAIVGAFYIAGSVLVTYVFNFLAPQFGISLRLEWYQTLAILFSLWIIGQFFKSK